MFNPLLIHILYRRVIVSLYRSRIDTAHRLVQNIALRALSGM